jgi:hypothetical protein
MSSCLLTDVPAHRIAGGRAPDLASRDPERAARVASAHILWLGALDDADRRACLDDVVAHISDPDAISAALRRWAPSSGS